MLPVTVGIRDGWGGGLGEGVRRSHLYDGLPVVENVAGRVAAELTNHQQPVRTTTGQARGRSRQAGHARRVGHVGLLTAVVRQACHLQYKRCVS